jgi:hypothetical protein
LDILQTQLPSFPSSFPFFFLLFGKYFSTVLGQWDTIMNSEKISALLEGIQ